MKLKAHEVAPYVKAPPESDAALLLFGEDAMRVADARAAYTLAVAGPQAEADMRLERLDAGDLRRDPAALIDALKARGFFDGPRVVIVEDATDGLSSVLEQGLSAWEPGDARLVVTAGSLTARSKLRKLFESAKHAKAGGLYDRPMTRDEIADALRHAGLKQIAPDGEQALNQLAQAIEPGDFRQVVEKLALYMRSVDAPVTAEDVAACAPRSTEADLDDLLDIVADGRTPEIGPTLQRVYAQGTLPVAICISLLRHFRMLHRAASDPEGVAAGVGRLRPPVYGPRRDKIARQAGRWRSAKLETALTLILDTDLALRGGSSHAPQQALLERALIRLAMQPGR
ncbi:MAG: DNA polymerase III subunit delta [Rhodobacterales bacterium]|nr:MAG: DNA polymerase III subunit delta [Rhodobacterales bacterium]